MDVPLSVAMRRYPHTAALQDAQVKVPGAELHFAEVSPIHEAFAPMVRNLAYDVSELATATWLQAFEAGTDIVGLPIVTMGNLPHRTLYALERGDRPDPGALRGKRVGIRAYAQTTGLWLRGALLETYGLEAQDITWVTTEGPHVLGAPEPPNVERTPGSLVDELRSGHLAGIVLGGPFAAKVDGIVPLIQDWETRQEAYRRSHGWIPANHVVVVKGSLMRERPELVRSLYGTLSQLIDGTRQTDAPTPQQQAVGHGASDRLLDMLDTAIDYARRQDVISRTFTARDLLAPALSIIGED